MPTKNDCPICKKTANAVASNKSGSVQCSTCDLWYHPGCAGVTPEMLELISKCKDLNMFSPWSCTVCKTAWQKIEKDIKRVASLAAANEKRIEKLENDKTDVDVKVVSWRRK